MTRARCQMCYEARPAHRRHCVWCDSKVGVGCANASGTFCCFASSANPQPLVRSVSRRRFMNDECICVDCKVNMHAVKVVDKCHGVLWRLVYQKAICFSIVVHRRWCAGYVAGSLPGLLLRRRGIVGWWELFVLRMCCCGHVTWMIRLVICYYFCRCFSMCVNASLHALSCGARAGASCI